MIPKSAIQKLKDRINLVELAESLGLEPKKSGANFVAFCPFHTEKNASFTINPKANLWHCFSCGEGGDSIKLYMKIKGKNFKEAVADLSAL